MNENAKEIFKKIGKAAFNVSKEVSPYIITYEVMKKVFYKYTDTDPFFLFDINDFPNLRYERQIFSNGTNDLVGYFYHYDNYRTNKVVIFVHGYGNGHKRYLDIIDYLCRKGFLVFSYDMTSFDESVAPGIRSFIQGVIDLENAIHFVREKSDYRGLPISLFGHSWGAYSSSTVLNVYPDIESVVEVSGFNSSEELIRIHKEEYAGEDAPSVDKYISAYEEYYFGRYAKFDAINGFKNSRAKILCIHSKDDKTVPIDAGLNLYEKEFKSSPRFTFVKFDKAGHGEVFYTKEARDYYTFIRNQYNEKFKKDATSTKEDRKAYLNSIIDKSIFLNMLDTSLMDYISDFLL